MWGYEIIASGGSILSKMKGHWVFTFGVVAYEAKRDFKEPSNAKR